MSQIAMFSKLLIVSSIILSSASFAVDKGGFSLGATRVIYDAQYKEVTVTVVNTADNAPFLAQSWISNNDVKSTKPPFVITPPLYRQDKGKNTLRIVKTGGDLPNDRESAFWVNVKALPAAKKPNENQSSISFAYVLKIKMFYRPIGLSGNASEAYKELQFSRSGSDVKINNPTPYHVTLNNVTVGGKEINDVSAMVPPFQQQSYQLPPGANGNQVEYRALNDQGGVLPVLKKNISQ